ncbi:MAG: hypothetical protein ABSG49_05660 [Methanoregula sp.]|jgi:hypothetical protein|uniref:hypothetical protein n=1 Tax=Methanoregula sp. TaxID=2052170 RepID=UPI003C1AD290
MENPASQGTLPHTGQRLHRHARTGHDPSGFAHKKRLYHGVNITLVRGNPTSAVEQYVIDENGNKVAVILPLTEYQHLKEDLHDLAMVAERRDEGTLSLAGLKKRVM